MQICVGVLLSDAARDHSEAADGVNNFSLVNDGLRLDVYILFLEYLFERKWPCMLKCEKKGPYTDVSLFNRLCVDRYLQFNQSSPVYH